MDTESGAATKLLLTDEAVLDKSDLRFDHASARPLEGDTRRTLPDLERQHTWRCCARKTGTSSERRPAWAFLAARSTRKIKSYGGSSFVGAIALFSAAGRDDGIDPVQLTRIAADRLNESAPQFSPDGRSVAYIRGGVSLTELLVKQVDALTATALV